MEIKEYLITHQKRLGEEPWLLPEDLTTATAHTRNRCLFSLAPASPASHVRHMKRHLRTPFSRTCEFAYNDSSNTDLPGCVAIV